MATKAELEAELAKLKARLAERPDPAEEDAGDAEDSADGEDETASPVGDSTLDRILEPHGISSSDLETLFAELSDELGALPQTKPILTALGAFALGFVAGRMSK